MCSARSLFCAALAATLTGVRALADVPSTLTALSTAQQSPELLSNLAEQTTCNGQTVTVPKNLQVAFPATFVSFADFYASSGNYKNYKCQITGNYIAGTTAVTAPISISQFSTTTTQGYITNININGDICVDVGNKPTLTACINDPNGVYSAGNSASSGIDP